jgi:N-methylhydantoinase B
MASKIVGIGLKRGDRLLLETPGGGGFGEPADRDRAAIRRDVALGYVSADAACRDYGDAS